MGFEESTKMDGRRLLSHRVLEEGWTLSAACRAAQVDRKTGRLWVDRARVEGIAEMAVRSRRPHSSPSATPEEARRELLELKARYPGFGAKKLCALMDGRLALRTANRILMAEGLRCVPGPGKEAASLRFERELPNELWQTDFKGLSRKARFQTLSTLDDASRFLLTLALVPDQTLASVWSALWEAFGEYGLPEALLSDNGGAFRASGTWRPSAFDARLMRLGVRPAHGRPYHPQTQGKVERFHGTLEKDLGTRLAVWDAEEAALRLRLYRGFYNWERPHESLGQRKPGALYRPSRRVRPDRLPEAVAEGEERKVDDGGFVSFKGRRYKLGKGMVGEWIGIQAGEGDWNVRFAGFTLGKLEEFAK